MGSLNRRALFGAAPALAALAIPAVVAAEPDAWGTFIAGVSLMHPKLVESARAAQAAGYQPDECYSVIVTGHAPFLGFRREYGPGSQELVNFQNGRAH